jgi:hypothetical protein
VSLYPHAYCGFTFGALASWVPLQWAGCGTGSGDVTPPYVVTPFQVRFPAGEAAGGGAVVIGFAFLSMGRTQGIVAAAPHSKVTLASAASLINFYSASRNDHFLDFSCVECGDLYVELRPEASPPPCGSTGAFRGCEAGNPHPCSFGLEGPTSPVDC